MYSVQAVGPPPASVSLESMLVLLLLLLLLLLLQVQLHGEGKEGLLRLRRHSRAQLSYPVHQPVGCTHM